LKTNKVYGTTIFIPNSYFRKDGHGSAKIKWDEKTPTGQQHSTLQTKLLIKIIN